MLKYTFILVYLSIFHCNLQLYALLAFEHLYIHFQSWFGSNPLNFAAACTVWENTTDDFEQGAEGGIGRLLLHCRWFQLVPSTKKKTIVFTIQKIRNLSLRCCSRSACLSELSDKTWGSSGTMSRQRVPEFRFTPFDDKTFLVTKRQGLH